MSIVAIIIIVSSSFLSLLSSCITIIIIVISTIVVIIISSLLLIWQIWCPLSRSRCSLANWNTLITTAMQMEQTKYNIYQNRCLVWYDMKYIRSMNTIRIHLMYFMAVSSSKPTHSHQKETSLIVAMCFQMLLHRKKHYVIKFQTFRRSWYISNNDDK